MKKLILFLALLLSPSLVKAESVSIVDSLKYLPSMKQGVAWDFQGRTLDYLTTAEIINKYGFSLSAGYTTSNKAVASIDYDLGGLNKFGINTPITNLIDLRLGFYVGLGNLSTSNGEDRNKIAYGPEVTIVSVKF